MSFAGVRVLALWAAIFTCTGWLSSAGAIPPHDASAATPIGCLDCHALYDDSTTNKPRGAAQETACKGCHNATGQAAGKHKVANHVVNGGAKIIDCGTCHVPHGNRVGPTDNTGRGGLNQDNIKLIRMNPDKYEAGAIEPIFHTSPDHLAFGTGSEPFNGICNVCHTTTAHHRREGVSGGDHDHWIGENCLLCHPHELGFGSVAEQCDACHLDVSDLDNWDINDGTKALVSTTEWQTYGHGAVGFTAALECLNCHDNTVSHHDAANPFRLANFDWDTRGWNGTCLICHDSTGPGYGGDSASVYVASAHNGVKHGAGNDGGTLCWDCHDPHGDGSNVKMIGSDLMIEKSDAFGHTGTRTATAIIFTNDGPGGDWATTAPAGDKLCNACHAATDHYTQSGGDGHNSAARCTDCHTHDGGFTATESDGGTNCAGCHAQTWAAVDAASGRASAHRMGSLAGTNDAFADSGLDWDLSITSLSDNAPSSRSCVSMCHIDHVHNVPGATEHEYNVHQDARTAADRSVTRDGGGSVTVGTPARTDFDAVAAGGGLCVSCHRKPILPGGLTVDRDQFAGSAHNYSSDGYGTWSYTMHDASQFGRNCTKCHSDSSDSYPDDSTGPFGAVHASDYDSLLVGEITPNGDTSDFVCFVCHGDGTTGVDRSGKDLVTAFAKTYAHPVAADAVHASTEWMASYNDGTFSGANRHANCVDCHNPHASGFTLHTPGGVNGNLMGADSPLLGVPGVTFTYAGLAEWQAPDNTHLSWTTAASYEYEICFKCHSSFAFGASPPTGISGKQETDLAQEFSPNNRSGHPIVTSLNNYVNSPGLQALAADKMQAGWQDVGNQTMTCSDCHGNDAAGGEAEGVHASDTEFVLKGPNTYWPTNASAQLYNTGNRNMNDSHLDGLFCRNCHTLRQPTGEGRDTAVWYGNNVHALHGGDRTENVACITCHILVPHGGKLSRLIADRNGTMPSRYAYLNDTNNVRVQEFIKAGGAGSYSDTNCEATCHSVTINGENW